MRSGPLVHGLAGDRVAADWPALRAGEVTAVLAAFPQLQGPFTIAWRSPRPLSAAALVRTATDTVFVKRHHRRVRTPTTLAEEHAFIAYLRRRDVPVPEVLADGSGATTVVRGEWSYEVHARAAGLDLYRHRESWTPLADRERARGAGAMLARLHRSAAGYTGPQRSSWILVSRDDLLRAPDPLGALSAQLPARPALADYLAQRDWRDDLAPIVARQRALQPRIAALPRLWTHNDWHASNLCWYSRASAAGVSAVFDFGLASPTFALYDLATAIERNCIAWLHLDAGMSAGYPRVARALLAGYADVLPLPDRARALLAELLPIVHLDYALSEIEYFQGITGSTQAADVAYATFLLGHAAWFDTAPGMTLLDAVREAD